MTSIDEIKKELRRLSRGAFAIIELVEVAGVDGASFDIIRKRLLDLGNDTARLAERLDD